MANKQQSALSQAMSSLQNAFPSLPLPNSQLPLSIFLPDLMALLPAPTRSCIPHLQSVCDRQEYKFQRMLLTLHHDVLPSPEAQSQSHWDHVVEQLHQEPKSMRQMEECWGYEACSTNMGGRGEMRKIVEYVDEVWWNIGREESEEDRGLGL